MYKNKNKQTNKKHTTFLEKKMKRVTQAKRVKYSL